MHAVVITFVSSVPVSELHEPFEQYAHALNAVPGLVAKTWIVDGSTLGGMHVFEDEAAADGYLGSDLLATVRGNDAFSDFDVRRFAVIDDLSAINNSPRAVVAG